MKHIVAGVLLLAASCSGQDGAPTAQGQVETDIAHGKELFQGHCVDCHGASAIGDGRLADSLPIPPLNLTVLAAANDGVFPSARIMEEVYGYPGKYHLGLMPEFGPILEGEKVAWKAPDGQVIMTPKSLLDLVGYLRSIQQD